MMVWFATLNLVYLWGGGGMETQVGKEHSYSGYID